MKDKITNLLEFLHLLNLVKFIRTQFYLFISIFKWKRLLENEKIMLELGAGLKKGSNGWTTVDIFGADITHDLRNGIPLPDSSVDRIYTSHMLEHIPYKELRKFLNECYRVLKKGGEFSVCVPDASLYINSYINGKQLLPKELFYQPAAVDTSSFIDQVNYIAYMDGQHKYMFDSENLINTLKLCPFTEVSLRAFDEQLDMKKRDFESIYASAIK